MKILLIGSGGREHALAWKLAQSKKVEKIYAAPGNGGTAAEEKTENLSLDGAPDADSGEALLEFARREKIDLTVVGPEAPLAAGIVDRFRGAGLAIVGPDANAARLETSKVYAKSFMAKYGVRTAKSRNFASLSEALGYAGSAAPPLVIKADGLAAGKGVVIAADFAETKKTLEAFMKDGALGEAGKSVVIEEYLEGLEVSILAAVSVSSDTSSGGRKSVIRPFIAARDHKRRFEGGVGPNTGGMGAIAPVPDFTAALQEDFENAILDPTLKGIRAEKMDYRGFIFFGVMVSCDRCYLLEYNVRLGDPETQAVLPLMDSDLAELCEAILDGSLADFPLKWKAGAVCAPVAVAEGYPGPYRKGDQIAINAAGFGKTGALLFAAGANREDEGAAGSGLRTSGGRVLAVSAHGSDADDARERAYEALRFVSFEGMAYRKDIGREEKGEENIYG
ncbi:MAG: phosphoribosylamine--glycine ligase [Treponema sp.]|jgi:phosphoribosylamine--glycine ligase|nr:phosphoribosylamine--glycine ligase [Treponema sp.]